MRRPRFPQVLHTSPRSAILTTAGVLWLWIAAVSWTEPGSLGTLPVTLEWLTPDVRGYGWAASGVVAIIVAVTRKHGCPDSHGWAALATMPVVRGATYLLSYLDSFVPALGDTGYRGGWAPAGCWLTVAFLVGLLARRVRDPHLPPVLEECDDDGGP
jgi:hypothetical protein